MNHIIRRALSLLLCLGSMAWSKSYSVTFYDYSGLKRVKDTYVVEGEAATAPELPSRKGLTFEGWDKDFSSVTEDMKIYPIYSYNKDIEYKFSVTGFADAQTIDDISIKAPDCFVVEKASIEIAGSADVLDVRFNFDDEKCPDDESVNVWKYVRNVDKLNITIDGLEVYSKGLLANVSSDALFYFNARRYLVYFRIIGENGWTEIGQQKVPAGMSATAPVDFEVPEDREFIGWDKDFSKISSVTGVSAQYKNKQWITYNFFDFDDSQIESLKFYEGETPVAPDPPKHKGLKFKGWDRDVSDFEYGKIISIHALYEVAETPVYNITITDYDPLVKATDPKFKLPNECFNAANRHFEKIYTDDYVEGQTGTAKRYNLRFYVETSKEGACADDSLANIWRFNTLKKVKPTIKVNGQDYYVFDITYSFFRVDFVDSDDAVLKSQIVADGLSATPPENPTREGFKFKNWNLDFSCIKEPTVVEAIYEKTRIVMFEDFDGSVIAEVEVVQGEPVEYPKAPSHAGFKFIGWNVELEKVERDEVVYPLYETSGSPEYKFEVANLKIGAIAKSFAIEGPNKCFKPTFERLYLDNELFDGVMTAGEYKLYFNLEVSNTGDCSNDSLVNIWGVYGETKRNNALTVNGDEKAFYYGEKFTGEVVYQFELKENVSSSSAAVSSSGTAPSSSSAAPASSSSAKPASSSSGTVASSSGNAPVSSSSGTSAKSSSSSNAKPASSSSGKNSIIAMNVRLQFGIAVDGRNLQISGARKGSTYAIFDLQGNVVKTGVADCETFNIALARTGAYLVRLGRTTRQIKIK